MNDFSGYADTPSAPARSIRAVTPDDDADLPDGVCKSIYVLTDGNLELVAERDDVDDAVTVPVTAGMIVPVRARRVMEDTTATVLALY